MDILNQFGINPILLLAQIVNFALLLFILKKFLYKPILHVLEQRKKKIEESLKNAEEIEKKLAQIAGRESAAILAAAGEGEKMIKEAGQESSRIIEDANKSAERILAKAAGTAKQLMVREREVLERSVKENVAEFIFLTMQKVTGKLLTGKDRKKIMEDAVKDLRS